MSRAVRTTCALTLMALLLHAQPVLAQSSEDEADTADGIMGLILIVGVIVVFFAFVLPYVRRERAKRERGRGNVVAAGEIVEGQLVELGEEIRAFDIDIELPTASGLAREAYGEAVDSYKRAAIELANARTLDGQRRAAQTTAVGRYQMKIVRSLLTGGPAPSAYVPPCFIDPTHGDSTTSVAYPEGGPGLTVPVCARCAHRRAAAARAATAVQEQPPAASWQPPQQPSQPPAYPPQGPVGYPPQGPPAYPPQAPGGYPPQGPPAYPPQAPAPGAYPPPQAPPAYAPPSGPPQYAPPTGPPQYPPPSESSRPSGSYEPPQAPGQPSPPPPSESQQ